jgi:hypothetical protein
MEYSTVLEEPLTLVQNLISKKKKMKNSIYLLMMFLGLALTSCEPMDDIHDELDARLDNRAIEGMAEYTLTDDDYDFLDVQFGNFSSIEDAGALIPQLLSDKFPVWGQGSLAQVTFDLYSPIELEAYTVAEEDYAIVGLDLNYFTKTSQIKKFLSTKYSQAKTNDYVRLTYRTVAVEVEYKLTDEDFSHIGETFEAIYPDPAWSAGNYFNFERRAKKDRYWSNEMILEALNVVMDENFEGVEGQTYEISYLIYDGNSGTESMKVRYDGSSYVVFGGERYELSDDDYDLIGAEFAETYPNPATSAAQFGNFDKGYDENAVWSDEMIVEALDYLLKQNFPNAEEGEVFNVIYETYDGTRDYPTLSLVFENGEYVISNAPEISTIIENQVYAHGDGSWMMPLTLPDNIYTEEFEQKYNNLGSEADAGFYIGRWLEPRFPYAQQGDFVSVAYDYYDDGIVTRYASFIYDEDNREWEFIPSVIEQKLQFGHEGTGWVVDNTIVHTLAAADYAFIGDELADEYAEPASSAKRYSNFDRRPGNANQWTDAMLLEAFNLLLNERVAPSAQEGQKYLMTFDIYNGTNTIEQMHLIKENGVWVPVQ